MFNESSGVGNPHIVKCPGEYSMCTGCSSCEMLCSMYHDGLVSPSHRRLFVEQAPTQYMRFEVYTCQQCAEAPCYAACPLKGKAMKYDENNILYIDEHACIGCGKCVSACRYTPSRINMVKSTDRSKRKAKKCDLCRTRPEGPACVEWCPAKCLELNDKALPWEGGIQAEKDEGKGVYI